MENLKSQIKTQLMSTATTLVYWAIDKLLEWAYLLTEHTIGEEVGEDLES